jgi:hypothetical protein
VETYRGSLDASVTKRKRLANEPCLIDWTKKFRKLDGRAHWDESAPTHHRSLPERKVTGSRRRRMARIL